TTSVFDRAKGSHTILQLHAAQQSLLLILVQCTQYAHCVLTLKTKPWMHELVGKLTRTREQQQTLGIEVQPADRLPFSVLQTRQLAKYGWTVLRVVVRHNFAHGLVVRNDPRWGWVNSVAYGLSVHLDLITVLN